MGKISKVNGIDIWWEDYGKKSDPTVMLIMGAGANCMKWQETFVQGLVANGLHVVKFDNRDVGKSTWISGEPFFSKIVRHLPLIISNRIMEHVFSAILDDDGKFKFPDSSRAEYNLDDMAKDTVALMDHLDIDKAHLVGVSMGGMISQIICLDHPERALTLTAIMSSPGMAKDSSLPGPTQQFFEGWKEYMLLNLQGRKEDGIVKLYEGLAGSRFPFDEKMFREYYAPVAAHGNNPYPAHSMAVGASPDRTGRLCEIRAPTLVIHGSEDPLIPLDHGMALVNNIPNAKTYIMEGAGHELPANLTPEIIAQITALLKEAT